MQHIYLYIHLNVAPSRVGGMGMFANSLQLKMHFILLLTPKQRRKKIFGLSISRPWLGSSLVFGGEPTSTKIQETEINVQTTAKPRSLLPVPALCQSLRPQHQ